MQSTHWCVLTPNMITRNSQINFQGNNMGHMGESLLPCWSLLFELGAMQQQQHGVRGKAAHTNNDSSFGCGIDTSALGPLRGWSKALVVEAMKCKIYDGRTANETKPNDQLHHPNLYLMSPYYRHMQYISHPSHAHLLRQNLVSDAYISNHKSYDGSERPLQIGLLERKKSRVILNLHDIAAGLSNAMPDTNLTITNFDHGPMIREQAEWWSTKDVIIAAHGSGVMNSVFITPKTIVLQIYPPGWYWPTIEPLITQVGGIALDWYDPEYNPQSLKLSKQSKADKIKANQMNFTVPVKDIVERVMIATGRTDANFQQLVNLLGVPAMYNGAF
mmetsp:Transcript_9362/g.14168  ORF Transcript_9362/g.14168 Transcript_9362/m.14168 type:complete len:331 (+) Transcript_9362:61-1053(+)